MHNWMENGFLKISSVIVILSKLSVIFGIIKSLILIKNLSGIMLKLFLVDLLQKVFSMIPLNFGIQIIKRSISKTKILPGNLIYNTNLEICIKTFQVPQKEWHTKIFSGMIWQTVSDFFVFYMTYFNLNICLEHFIVWMRTAGLPNFRKLWGKIDTDLKAGQYKVKISNNYQVKPF